MTVLLTWSLLDGDLLNQFNIRLLLEVASISLIIIFLNSRIISQITVVYGKGLNLAETTLLSVVSALGNSLAGLPLGTGIKLFLMKRRGGLTARQVVAGFLYYTFLNCFILLNVIVCVFAFSSCNAFYMLLPIVIAFVVFILLYLGRSSQIYFEVIAPLLNMKFLVKSVMTSVTVVFFMLYAYRLALFSFYPELSNIAVTWMSASSLLAGFSVGAQSLGGGQELIMGMAMKISNYGVLDGVEVALFLRVSFLCTSVVMFSVMLPYIYKEGWRASILFDDRNS